MLHLPTFGGKIMVGTFGTNMDVERGIGKVMHPLEDHTYQADVCTLYDWGVTQVGYKGDVELGYHCKWRDGMSFSTSSQMCYRSQARKHERLQHKHFGCVCSYTT